MGGTATDISSFERAVGTISGALIILFALDLPRTIILVFGLPIPWSIGPVPLMFAAMVPLLGSLVYMAAQTGRAEPITVGELLFTCTLAIWISLEVFNEDRFGASYSLVFETSLALIAYWAGRLYAGVFSADELIRLFVTTGSTIVAVHFVLVAAIRTGIPVPLVVHGELLQRNSVSMLGVGVCFVAWYFPVAVRNRSLALLWLPLLSIAQMTVNGSRSALVIFIALAGARYVLKAHRSQPGAFLGLLVVTAGVVIFMFASLLLEFIIPLISVTSDDALSVVSRTGTNALLVQELLMRPVTGIGMATVAETKVAGYMSHTYLLLPPAAYGIVGMVPLALSFLAMLPRTSRYPVTATVTFVLVMLLFVNDIWPWLGMLVALSALPPPTGRGIDTMLAPKPREELVA